MATEDERVRLFVALPAPDAVVAAAGLARAALGDVGRAARWVEPANLHLTVQFLGATPPALTAPLGAALAAAAGAGAPFALRTGGLGLFPAPTRPRVIWLGLTGQLEALRGLHAAVLAATAPLGFAAEARPFAPHLTLGRVRDGATPEERARLGRLVGAARPPAPAAWPVADLVLVSSRLGRAGPTYRVVGRWHLGHG
jgi:RNA 2',3'-cyclic 3'-phosphodiesterase